MIVTPLNKAPEMDTGVFMMQDHRIKSEAAPIQTVISNSQS